MYDRQVIQIILLRRVAGLLVEGSRLPGGWRSSLDNKPVLGRAGGPAIPAVGVADDGPITGDDLGLDTDVAPYDSRRVAGDETLGVPRGVGNEVVTREDKDGDIPSKATNHCQI